MKSGRPQVIATQVLVDFVALLAMKERRAPLPVSSALSKRLLRRGFTNNPLELGDFARRYLFLGDERMLLAELKRRPPRPAPTFEESPDS